MVGGAKEVVGLSLVEVEDFGDFKYLSPILGLSGLSDEPALEGLLVYAGFSGEARPGATGLL